MTGADVTSLDTQELNRLMAGLSKKADKIRALDKAGLPKADIARFLNVRYQHVRNTLVVTRPKSDDIGLRAEPSSRSPEPWSIQKLTDAGFSLLASCALSGDDAFAYSALAPKDAGVYAFAVDGVVKYVGLTRGGLRIRLGHYVYGHKAQRTSSRVKGLILDALRQSRCVQVLVATPPNMEWNGLPVDGAAGLETGLISLIKPDWNQQGAKR